MAHDKIYLGERVPLEKTYEIMPFGMIVKGTELEEDCNCVTLRMNEDNTLMVSKLLIKDISMEIILKCLLMAHAEFLTNYVIPRFTSELETKDETGVVDRVSNMPGRGMKRMEEGDQSMVRERGAMSPDTAATTAATATAATTAATATAAAAAAASTAVETVVTVAEAETKKA